MDKKRKTLLVSIFAILLLIVFMSGYTFAKYYTDYKEEVSGEIAKWKFDVSSSSEITTGQISLINTANEISLEDGKIAPGAQGSFEIELDADDSEVDVKYYIEIAESGNKPDNLLFSVTKESDGQTSNTYSSLSQLADSELTGVIARTSNSQKETLTINWIWPYETSTNENGVNETNSLLRNQIITNQDIEDTTYGSGTVEEHEDEFDYGFVMNVVGTQAKTSNN